MERDGHRIVSWVLLSVCVVLLLASGLLLFGPGADEPPPAEPDVPEREEGAAPTLVGRAEATPAPEAEPSPTVPNARSLAGHVVDDATDRVLGGVEVFVTHQFARRDDEPAVRTRADGSFVFGAFVAGVADCCIVEHPDYAPFVLPLPHEVHGIELGATYDLGDLRLVRGAVLAGEVKRADGRPAVGAAVCVCDDFGLVGGFRAAHPSAEAQTDGQGRFRLDRVAPAVRGAYDLIALSAEGAGWVRLPARVGREDVEGVVVTLREGAQLEVRVEDTEGKGIGEARLLLQPRLEALVQNARWLKTHDLFVARPAQAAALLRRRADADGRAHFTNLPTDDRGRARYDVVAWAKGYAQGWTDGVELRRGERAEVVVVLHAKAQRRVHGRVTTTAGAPVANAVVRVHGGDETRTDVDGHYEFDAIGERWEWVQVGAEAEGYAPAWRRIAMQPGIDAYEADLVLRTATPIAGRVIDQHGAPVEGAYLALSRAGARVPEPSQRTDAAGVFRYAGASVGTWNLSVLPPAPYDAWKDVGRQHVVDGGDESVEIVLHRVEVGRCTVIARVVEGATGSPLDPSEARLVWAGEGDRPYVPIAEIDGRHVRAERVKPGRWYVWAMVSGVGVAFAAVEVDEEDELLETVLRVGATGKIVGRVDFGDLESPGRVFVFLESADHRGLRSWLNEGEGNGKFAMTAEDGSFELGSLAPALQRVRLEATGFLGEAVVAVPAGGTVNVVVPARQGGVLAFRTEAEVPRSVVVEFFVAVGDADHRMTMRLGGRKASIRKHEATVEPGRVRWRVRFDPDSTGGDRHWAEPVEGEVVVAAGERAEVSVPVKVR